MFKKKKSNDEQFLVIISQFPLSYKKQEYAAPLAESIEFPIQIASHITIEKIMTYEPRQ